MRFDNRHIFEGDLNGQTLSDFKQYNYEVKDLESRLKFINEKLNEKVDEKGLNFFENYIEKHYKNKLSGNDELSENHAVFKTLENMGNYLLGSTEIRELRKSEEQQYKFYVDETEFKLRTQKEQLFENLSANNEISSDNVIHFLLSPYTENYKLAPNLTITSKDLNDGTRCAEILRDYNEFLKHINVQLKNPSKKYKGKRYLLTKAKSDVLGDMLLTKTQLHGIIKSKHVLKDSGEIDWDCFEWENHKHVKELIYANVGFHPENNLSFHILDLNTLTDEMIANDKFTKAEKQIYKLIRKGCKNNEIAEILNVRRTYISNSVAIIVKKISDYAVSKKWNKKIV